MEARETERKGEAVSLGTILMWCWDLNLGDTDGQDSVLPTELSLPPDLGFERMNFLDGLNG